MNQERDHKFGFLEFLRKLRKHGIRGAYRIGRSLLRCMIVEIRHGARLQDKLALAIRWLLMPFVIIAKGRYPYAEFYPFDIMLKTPDGSLFHAKSGTGDCYAILFDELPLGEKFRISEDLLSISDGIFIDVGANIGKYTIKTGKQLGTRGTVVAIEPAKEVYQRLLANIELNGLTNVIALNIAAGSSNQIAVLHVEPLYHGSSSLCPDEAKGEIVWHKQVEVQVRRLDEIIEELQLNGIVKLVKIDVEGYEAHVLEGMQKILKQHKPQVIFEAWDENHLQKAEEKLGAEYQIKKVAPYSYIALPKE